MSCRRISGRAKSARSVPGWPASRATRVLRLAAGGDESAWVLRRTAPPGGCKPGPAEEGGTDRAGPAATTGQALAALRAAGQGLTAQPLRAGTAAAPSAEAGLPKQRSEARHGFDADAFAPEQAQRTANKDGVDSPYALAGPLCDLLNDDLHGTMNAADQRLRAQRSDRQDPGEQAAGTTAPSRWRAFQSRC